MSASIEIIRENLTPSEVLKIREQVKRERVNVNRLHSELVQIEIIHPSCVINAEPQYRLVS